MVNPVPSHLSTPTLARRIIQGLCINGLAFLLIVASASLGFSSEVELSGKSDLPFTKEIHTGNLRISVSAAKGSVDLDSLLKGVGEGDTMQLVSKKVDRIRKKKYPNEEIRLEVENIALQTENCGYIDLKMQIEWWNNVNKKGYGWKAKNVKCGASCIFVKVLKGRYKHYVQERDGWLLDTITKAGEGWTTYFYGAQGYDGYRGVGLDDSNKADIVMYFFR